MDTSHKILDFFKKIWSFMKKIWRIIVHANWMNERHGGIIVVIIAIFFIMVCICSHWAQYLDEKDWKQHPISEPASASELFTCPTLESLDTNAQKKKEFNEGKIFKDYNLI